MANMVYDLVDPQELIDYVRAWENEVLRPEARFSLDQYLPNKLIDDLEFRVRKGALNDVDAAEFRAWDTTPKMTGRPGVSRISGSLGPVSRQIPLGEEEMLRVNALLRGNNDPIINAIFDDAERMIRSVAARIELARGDLIDDGKVVIQENGLTLEADFGRDASMSETAGVVWTDTANATPLTNMLGWVETYVDLNGVEPGSVLMSRTRIGDLALNEEIRDFAAANGTTPQRVTRATIDNILATEGLPPIELYDTKVRVDGVRTNVLDPDKIFLMPPAGEPVGNTFYGITAEAIKLRAKGMIKQESMPGIVAVVLESDSPVQTFTLGTAIAVPAMPNPDLIMDVEVA